MTQAQEVKTLSNSTQSGGNDNAGPGERLPQPRVKRPPISPQFVAKVRELFMQGADTTEISKMLKASEALVYNALGRSQP